MKIPKVPAIKIGALKVPPVAMPGGTKVEPFGGPLPDPLAKLKPTGDVEADSKAELSALQAAFRERNANEKERFERETDSEHWFAVTFETREQKEALLTAIGMLAAGDKYLDGRQLAKALKVELPDGNRRYNVGGKADPKLVALT